MRPAKRLLPQTQQTHDAAYPLVPCPARARCAALVNNSIGIVTALLPVIGYHAASTCAAIALAENRGVAEVLVDKGVLTAAQARGYCGPRACCASGEGSRNGCAADDDFARDLR